MIAQWTSQGAGRDSAARRHRGAFLCPFAGTRRVARIVGSKSATLLAALALWAAAALPPALADGLAPPSELSATAHAFAQAPVLDGSLQEWSEIGLESTARLDRKEQCHPAPQRRAWSGPGDASAVVQVGVHGEDLYFGVRFEDDVTFHDPERPWWHGDSLEIFFNADLEVGKPPAKAFTAGCWQVFLMPQNPELPWGVVFHGRRAHFDDGGLKGVRVASRRVGSAGWTAEISIPLRNFGRASGSPPPLGFALALNDADSGPEDPGSYLSWNQGFDLYRYPHHFGRLELPTASPAPSPAPAQSSAWFWLLPLLVLLVTGALLLGPVAKALRRVTARPKWILLGLIGLLALALDAQRSRTLEEARLGTQRELTRLAEAARPIVLQARAIGALQEPTAAQRALSLTQLLAGESVPARPGVEASAFVRMGDGDAWPPGGLGEASLALENAREFPLPESVAAQRLQLRTTPPLATLSRLVPGSLGQLDVLLEGDVSLRFELPQLKAAVPDTLDLGGTRLVRALRWTPGEARRPLHLSGVTARDASAASVDLMLCSQTEAGVPVLAHPAGAFVGATLPAGAQRNFDLPVLLGGADRLWLLASPTRSFPQLLGDEALVRVQVQYDRGDDQELEFRNGEHFAQERLPIGLERPATLRSRVAWQVQDTLGMVHNQTALVLPLDAARLARRLVVRNEGAGGDLRLLAATVVRTRRPEAEVAIQLMLDAGRPIDRVHALGVREHFEGRVGGQPLGEEVVSLVAEVGPAEAPIALRLEQPMDPAAQLAKERASVALLACLGLALLLAVLLAVDLAERARTLAYRLGIGVLAAALVPLGVTIFLMDQQSTARIESERKAAARGGLTALSERLAGAFEEVQEVARRVARQLAAEGEIPGLDLHRILELHGLTTLDSDLVGSARVSGAKFPPLLLEVGARGGLSAPRFLASAAAQRGIRYSPWDGLMLIGSARSGRAEDWVQVVLGLRVESSFLARVLDEFPAQARRASAVLDREGGVIVHAGTDAQRMAADLSPHLGSLYEDPWVDGAGLHRTRALEGSSHVLAARGLSSGDALLVVGVDRLAIGEAVAEQRVPLVWIGSFGLLLVLVATAVMARRVAAPVEELARTAEGLRQGRFDLPLPAAGSDEVGRLTLAFDQMRRELRSRLEDLDFLRNAQEELSASLEFRTRARAAARLFHEISGAGIVHLLDVSGPDAPATLSASVGMPHDLVESPFVGASQGWIREAALSREPLELDTASSDPRLSAETGAGRRLLEGVTFAILLPLRAMTDLQGILILGYPDRASVPRPSGRRLFGPLCNTAASALNNARLYRLAALDEVTRLPGATAFEAALRADVERAAAGQVPVTLLRIGVDHLEHIARRRGVEHARVLLRAHAQALRAILGERRQLGRLSDDELAVRLPGASEEEVRDLAERIRTRLARIEIRPEQGGESLASTVSIGVARCPSDARSPEFLLDAAARARAAARREGGDRVEDVQRLRAVAVDAPPFEEGAVFHSAAMVDVVESARRAAKSDASVLITGETGTGKEVIASLIHRRSARATRPMISVNCAAFPETLLESELFGHERGAFTGADRRREGRFELADGGTLFLDEIAEMSPTAQVKLLRVLQERQFTRLGGTRAVTTDVRIIAATNQVLESAVQSGRFREDLYYRLNVVRLQIPPLRERREEIPILVEHFLQDLRRRHGRAPSAFAPAAMDLLYRYPWPGNVRELKNVVERCAVLGTGEVIEAAEVQLEQAGGDRHSAMMARSAPGDDLNPRQRALLEYLARNGRCTNREYYEMSGTSPRTGLRDLKELMQRGLVLREGRRRGAAYRLP